MIAAAAFAGITALLALVVVARIMLAASPQASAESALSPGLDQANTLLLEQATADLALNAYVELERANSLDAYRQAIGRATTVLDELERRELKWGVVTNKAECYTHPLLKLLDVHHRAACIIGGDTTGKTKPDPAPLFAAVERINIPADACIYVGDDRRDVQAGRAAGMKTVVEIGRAHV